MALEIGSRIAHYDVTALIGEGGMGQVYQATDTKLNRQVALKILPEAFATDPDRLARFQREAQVLASLNHPGIAAIYGIEEQDDARALVLELVEGPTLADRIAQGPIPVDEALPIAKQIAEALEAAHEAGVIHRDLKPANIKVREDGTVKVLDFGLAKAFDTTPQGDPSQSQTLTTAATQMGMVIGTAAYMSPEQARGKPVNKRTDIWAFGVVLYEMLAGARPFQGEDVSLTLASVMKSDVDVKTLPKDVPATVRTVLDRCLEKDASRRIRDIGDVSLAMEGAFETTVSVSSGPTVSPSLPAWQRPAAVAATVLVAVALGGLAVWALLGIDTAPSSARFTLTLPDSDQLPRGVSELLALSPDGQTLVYSATRNGIFQLFRRPIDEFEATPIRGAEVGPNSTPFFSPDGQWVGFVGDGALQKVALAGGAAQTLTTGIIRRGTSWGTDDMIIYGADGPLMQIPGAGGDPTPLFTSDDNRQSWYPQVLRDGDAVLFTLSTLERDAGELHLLFLETGEHKTLLPDAVAGHVLSTGHLVFVRSGALWAVPFDEGSLDIAGTPVPVAEGVRVEGGGAVQYAVSDNGTLVYIPGGVSAGENTLFLVDRQGTIDEVPLPSNSYVFPRFSPDGTRIAVQINAGDDSNIFIYEIATNRLRQLTFDGGAVPLWTPDGTQVTFLANDALWNIAADFSEEPQLLSTASEEFGIGGPYSWSPDGSVLFWNGTGGVAQLTLLEDGEVEHGPLLVETYLELVANFSADGRWFSYVTNEAAGLEVFVQPYPLGSGAKRRITQDGGRSPVWSRSGRELFYANERQLWAVGISTEPTLTWQDPVALFESPSLTTSGNFVNYDVTPDGQRFVFVQPLGDTDSLREINVVMNWFEELKERVPIP